MRLFLYSLFLNKSHSKRGSSAAQFMRSKAGMPPGPAAELRESSLIANKTISSVSKMYVHRNGSRRN